MYQSTYVKLDVTFQDSDARKRKTHLKSLGMYRSFFARLTRNQVPLRCKVGSRSSYRCGTRRKVSKNDVLFLALKDGLVCQIRMVCDLATASFAAERLGSTNPSSLARTSRI
jgi:hypothetical protein